MLQSAIASERGMGRHKDASRRLHVIAQQLTDFGRVLATGHHRSVSSFSLAPPP